MKKSIIALALVGLFAVSCGEKKAENSEVQANETTEQTTETAQANELSYTLEWTAFKTPAKVGVKGGFEKIELMDVVEAPTVIESLKNAKFIVNTATVNTNDAGRDDKLKAEFFAKMTGNITGFFGEFKDGKAIVHITMNGVTKDKEFSYTEEGNVLTLNGSIDILSDFTAETAFESLHNACKVLHEDKTWSDVDLAITINK